MVFMLVGIFVVFCAIIETWLEADPHCCGCKAGGSCH